MSDELGLVLDHVSLSVGNLERAKAFYLPALASLGLELVGEVPADVSGTVSFAGFGIGRKGSFWLAENGRTTPPTHVCFRAESRAMVDAFHAAGLAAGGRDNGGPGIREIYHRDYYAAFVFDPEGHNIEAVTFQPADSDDNKGGHPQ
ncbi:MAG: VOC family protein [Alphaproteobacteria bacterium]